MKEGILDTGESLKLDLTLARVLLLEIAVLRKELDRLQERILSNFSREYRERKKQNRECLRDYWI